MRKKKPSNEEAQCTRRNQQLKAMLQSAEVQDLQRRLEGLNFFELCGMNKQETKHSYFLLNLFDVHGKHGWGDAFAKAFCDQAGISLPQEFFSKLGTAKREYKFKNNDSRVDLLLYANKTVILIENKVDASLHDNQLTKYENGIDEDEFFKGYTKYYVFLTKDGRMPESGNQDWRPVSYGAVIDAILEAQQTVVPGKDADADEYAIFIKHYIKFLRREVIMNIEDLDTEAKGLYKQLQEQFPDAVAFLSKEFPDEKVVAVSQKIAAILQQEKDTRKLRLSRKDGIVGAGRIQFKTERLNERFASVSPSLTNPFFYEISIDGSNDTKKIMKAYAYARDQDVNEPTYQKVRSIFGKYETKHGRKPKTGKSSHVLELNGGNPIYVYDVYDKLESAPENGVNLGEKILRNFVDSILDEIEEIEKKL